MILKGRVWKDGGFWLIECPDLQALTQGTSKANALDMMVDWVRTMLDDPKFTVEIAASGEHVSMTFADPTPILGLMVLRNRTAQGLTLQDVATRLGKKTRSAASVYETGKHDPGFSTATKIFNALGFELVVTLEPLKGGGKAAHRKKKTAKRAG